MQHSVAELYKKRSIMEIEVDGLPEIVKTNFHVHKRRYLCIQKYKLEMAKTWVSVF